MNQRLAAALIGTTMGLATFAGSTIAVSAAAPEPEPPQLTQEDVSKVICRVLKELDLLDDPNLQDLVVKLGCKKTSPTQTTTTQASEPGRR
ncbi:hypothetical protein LZG04_19625 [Saccharothrix sp. S26]|uniref:hypothetical protein n=1 Tax=Saccharothrix sp. S26 TaxID=2907215 RepID=UPI001F23D108|nr:hypothetical protein [Saccharothrix sp. S26]MCE6996997.1 hypothetical protein [Saccharothrix sp. S26]